jgi:hypothetical protein
VKISPIYKYGVTLDPFNMLWIVKVEVFGILVLLKLANKKQAVNSMSDALIPNGN